MEIHRASLDKKRVISAAEGAALQTAVAWISKK